MINKIKQLIKLIIRLLKNDFFIPYKGFKKIDLIFYDTIYPHPVSGFRLEEFTELLKHFNSSKILTNSLSYRILGTPNSQHRLHIEELLSCNKGLKNKIKISKGFKNVYAKLFYCVFINNIYKNLYWLEKYKIPFIFTLYPGGGFRINDKISNEKLNRVLNSSMFRKVIVTQEFTKNYLITNNLCSEKKIEFIFGGVVPQNNLIPNIIENKKKYLINKKTFDICFCAAKYMAKGTDKGYDVFIEFAHEISQKYNFIRFHIIGGFSEDDIDVSQIKENICFYGYQNFEQLGVIFKKMDVLISPNKPFFLSKGSFDGFPLGTAVEAALNGVVVLVSDELKQNVIFKEGEEIIIIENNSILIEEAIIDLIKSPEKLSYISTKTMNKFSQVYSNDFQMKPRLQILQNQLLINK